MRDVDMSTLSVMSTLSARAVGGATLLLLAACLVACDNAAPPHPAAAAAATAAAAPVTAPASAANAALEVAVAREQAARADREQTIRVQRNLVEQQRAHEAAQHGDGSERCVAGQKMRRVANGWVQAGTC